MTEPHRKKNFLSLSSKSAILRKIRSGISRDSILKEFCICARTYQRIVRNKDNILEKSESVEFRNKKSTRTAANKDLESVLLKWLIQKRDQGQPVPGCLLQEQATMFNTMLGGPSTFKASNGYLDKFKTRHGLRTLSWKDEILSNDESSAEEFSKILADKIMHDKLSVDNIYNADESGIYWKILFNHTLALHTEECTPGIKERKDQLTALFCANASGTHRIPLLIIGNSAKPRSLRNLIPGNSNKLQLNYLGSLGISYSSQCNAWMNSKIFSLWYESEFIPRVLDRQRKTGNNGKVLLILDNAPTHPPAEILNKVHPNFEIVYLPPNVTALIQPMDQSPISTTKKLYKKRLMRKLLIQENHTNIEDFLKQLDLRNSISMLSGAWHDVKESTLRNAWKRLIGNVNNVIIGHEPNKSIETVDSGYEMCDDIAALLPMTKDDKMSLQDRQLQIRKWFDENEGDCGWEEIADEDIVQSVMGNHNLTEVSEEDIRSSFEADESEVCEDEETSSTAKLAYENFLNWKKWMKTNVQLSEAQIRHMDELETITAKTVQERYEDEEKVLFSL